jgi:multicomponent Na+:H+ antiporter subunit G
MSAANAAADAALWAGIAITVLSCLGALTFRRVYLRLHYLTPMTSIGAPLVGLALAVQNGWGLTMAQIVFIVFVLAVTGPVIETTTGRVSAQREDLIKEESPR